MNTKPKPRRRTSREVTEALLQGLKNFAAEAWWNYDSKVCLENDIADTLKDVKKLIKTATKVAERLRKEIEQ